MELPDIVPSAPLEAQAQTPSSSANLSSSPPPPLPDPRAHRLALEACESVARYFDVKMIAATPLELGEEVFLMRRADGKRGRIAYADIAAVAVAAVGGLASKPVLVIDLIINWNDLGEGPLQLIRLRSDTFDIRNVISDDMRSIDAFRALQEQLLARTGAVPLPDRSAARGRPFSRYPDLDTYQREVLQVEG